MYLPLVCFCSCVYFYFRIYGNIRLNSRLELFIWTRLLGLQNSKTLFWVPKSTGLFSGLQKRLLVIVGKDRNIHLITKFKLLEHLCCPHTEVWVVCVLDSAPSGPMSLIEMLQDTDRKEAAADVLDKPQAKRRVAVRAQKPSFKVGQLSAWVPRGFRKWFSKVQSPSCRQITQGNIQ